MTLVRRRGRWVRKINNENIIKVKGKYTSLVLQNKNYLNFQVTKKIILMILNQLKKSNKITYGFIGIVGRGMVYESLRRSLKLNTNNIQRVSKMGLKIKNQKKVTKKKKKKLSEKMRFRRKWFNTRMIYRRTITKMGERGHFTFKRVGKSKLLYRKLNTLYKYIGIAGINLMTQDILKELDYLNIMKKFGPYKIKGMKKLYESGLIKEGKVRKY